MILSLRIENVQQVKSMNFQVDLADNKLTCIVGKNGVGKTTLIKSIQNLVSSDTFKKTSPDTIFGKYSYVSYDIDGEEFVFDYDSNIRSINCKKVVPEFLRKIVDVELPMPFGQRFKFFDSIIAADLEIRRSIVLEEYSTPTELIDFLNEIYSSEKFKNLKEIQVKGISYYCIVLDDSKYIREDYLSSGEFFLINLYTKIKNHCSLIVIDEIDISLDAAAQANLSKKLRAFCNLYGVNIIFTTHSLPMMKTMESDELFYMSEDEGVNILTLTSYSYVKSILFGFSGWDKYILTEDKVLKRFIEYVISKFCSRLFYKYKIIYIGGSGNVTNLMQRNSTEMFFSSPKNVICILDGDQRMYRHAKKENVYCIPIESVEKEILADYGSSVGLPRLPEGENFKDDKDLFSKLISNRLISEAEMFGYICDNNHPDIVIFSNVLQGFLSENIT
jgi:ABC-type multidrug transport system ATPase subunit